jgi:predicted esterase
MSDRAERPTPRAAPYDRSLPATVHGHYWVRPAKTEGAAPLLVGFHGYGENGAGFLRSLEAIPGSDAWHLASVQALHPFYTKRGEVVAGWMTRFDREHAIADNVAYARSAVAALREELAPAPVLVVAGFSQGVAMAYRAAAVLEGCSGVIALAGDVPPEVDPAGLPRVLLGQGEGDTWYTDEKREGDLARLAEAGVPVETCVFDGGHEWSDEFYAAAGRFLRRIAATP